MSFEARIIHDFSEIEPEQWKKLETDSNPFLSYVFLDALERTGSIGTHAGWQPYHLALYDDEGLLGFAPSYAKSNSHGEFVFDWAWADAYHRNDVPYYPKLLTAIPYSPVGGPRLLTRRNTPEPAAIKSALVDLAIETCRDQGFSTWHCNFVVDRDVESLDGRDLLRRRDWQFHWFNRDYGTFDDFLVQLRSRKRKSIRRERRLVGSAGIEIDWRAGDEISGDELDFVYHCYIDTFNNYGNYPALRKSFFEAIAAGLGRGFQVALARREGQYVAAAVFLQGGRRLYGRYWGCAEEIPGLHFELAYYQGIEFCIANGIEVFESGAQGEHKIGRGFIPTRTRSFHHVEHPLFREAISRHLDQEKSWLDQHRLQLDELNPYRRDQA